MGRDKKSYSFSTEIKQDRKIISYKGKSTEQLTFNEKKLRKYFQVQVCPFVET